MISTSAAFKTAIASTDREIRGYIKFNNTTLLRGVDGLISMKIHNALCDQDRPMIGCAVSTYAEVEFFNTGAAGVSLANSYFDAYIGVVLSDTGTAPSGSIESDTATVEYVFMGRFWISSIERNEATTKVTAYDAFGKLNKQYVPTVTASSDGYAIADILTDINTQCGLGFNATTANLGYVSELFSGTCREVLGWVMNVTQSSNNYLAVNVKVGRGTPQGTYSVHALSRKWDLYYDHPSYYITDSTIYMDGFDKNDDFTFSSVSSGTQEDPIVVGSGTGIVGENPYMTEAIATTIYNYLNGKTFTPMSVEFRGNPAFDICDVVRVRHDGTDYRMWIQNIITTFNGGLQQTLECYGDSEYHYSMSTSPTQAKINTVSTMVQEMQERIETADGGVITKILDTDGTWKELVIANSVDLSQATSVWRFNINGLEHSTSYSGGTVTTALDDQGRFHAGIIQTGILQDALGKNSWDLDTGAFTITDGSINITTSSSTFDAIQLNYNGLSCLINPTRILMANTGGLFGDYFTTLNVLMGSVACGTIINGNYYNTFWANAASAIVVLGDGTSNVNRVEARADSTEWRNASNVLRIRLNYDGFTFYNASGNTTASYTASAPSVSTVTAADTSGTLTFSTSSIVVSSHNSFGTVQLNIRLSNPTAFAAGTMYTIGNIGHTIKSSVYAMVPNQQGTSSCLVYIDTNGDVQIYRYSDSAAWTAASWIRVNVPIMILS